MGGGLPCECGAGAWERRVDHTCGPPAEMVALSRAVPFLLCTSMAHAMRLGSARLSAAEVATVSIEDAVAIFGRLADSKHVFTEPIRTAASGFEFSSNTAIKPKWLIGYVSREPCGEDVDLPTHNTRWASLLFPDGAGVCARSCFDSIVCGAEYTAPLGVPKWAIAGKVLIDAKTCAAQPSPAALDAFWTALGGGDELARDAVIARLHEWAKSDDLSEAVLFSEFWVALQGSAA